MEIEDFIAEVTESVSAGEYFFDECATAMDRNGPYHKQDVIAALLASEGVLVNAAVLLNRNRTRLYDYIRAHKDVLLFYTSMREGNIDLIEHNVMKAAVEGDISAARFILGTLGKGRGYSKRMEQTGPDGGPIRIEDATAKQELLDKIEAIAGRNESTPKGDDSDEKSEKETGGDEVKWVDQ